MKTSNAKNASKTLTLYHNKTMHIATIPASIIGKHMIANKNSATTDNILIPTF